jgi:hypothetical protein
VREFGFKTYLSRREVRTIIGGRPLARVPGRSL